MLKSCLALLSGLVFLGSPLAAQTAGTYTTFGAGCKGSNSVVPTLTNSGVPEIGKSFSVSVNKARAQAPCGLLTGGSKTAWGPINLPWDLTFLGATGCSLLVAWDSLAPFASDATGTGTVVGAVPNVTALIGLEFHQQILIVDLGANALNIAWTNGGTGKIGG